MSVVSAARSVVASTRLSLLHLRVERATFAVAFAVVGVTCFLFAAMPRAFAGFADRALRHQAAAASLAARGVQITDVARVPTGAGGDPFAPVGERGRRELARLPAPLPSLVGGSSTVVETARLVVQTGLPPIPHTTRYLTLQALPGAERRLTVLSGRLPRATGTTVTVHDGGGAAVRAPVLEIALSRSTAAALHARVGDRFASTPDSADALAASIPGAQRRPVVAQVVGVVRVTRPQAPFWFGDTALAAPLVTQSADLNSRFVYAGALVSTGAYGALLRAAAPVALRYDWRYTTDPARFHAADAGAIRAAASALEAQAASAGALQPTAQTQLRELVDGYLADRSQAETLLAIAAIGLLACCLAVIGLLAMLRVQRRRLAVELLRSRGASPTQVVGGHAAEGALLAVPAAAAGALAALAATRSGDFRLSGWLTGALAAATVAAFAAAAVTLARRRLETSPRDEIVLSRTSPRRLVLEGLVVVAAAVGVVLLRRRGIDAGSGGGSFDPYLAAVPVLLGLAAALLVLRAYPAPLELLARAAARRRGIVTALALARAARAPAVGALPLVVLILSLAIACFSAIVLRSISTGQAHQSWQQVGAELRVDGDGLPAGLAARLGATASARAYTDETSLASGAGEPGPQLLAVEPDSYRSVLAAGPAAAAGASLSGLGSHGGALDAIAAGTWTYGSELAVDLEGHTLRLHVVASRRAFPSAPPENATAVVSLPALERALGAQPVTPNRLYVDGARRRAVPDATVLARGDVLDQLRASPLVTGTTRGFRIAIGLAALYAALAVVLSVVLTARSRSRDLSYLATLGLSRRQALGLAAGELAPLALVSAAAGTALGIGVALLVEPAIDLSFFTGAESTPLALPAGVLAALACGLIALVALSALGAALLAARTDVSRTLRIGDTG